MSLSRTKRNFFWILLGSVAVYGAVCVDVVMRAKHAYGEGERASSPQLAYAWYEAAATLFVPPESKWSRLAREKLPQAKARWIAQLRETGIVVDEATFE